MAIHVQEMDPFRCTDLLQARAQKLQLPPEVQSNFRRYCGIRDVWLSKLGFFGVFQIIRKKAKPRSIGLSAKKSYFNCIFIKAM